MAIKKTQGNVKMSIICNDYRGILFDKKKISITFKLKNLMNNDRTSTAGRPLVCIISYHLYSKYSIVVEDHCQHQISMKFLFEPSLFFTVTNYY
jgi:hypothetical protein